jgi:polysaccharide biosynthesis protein PslH
MAGRQRALLLSPEAPYPMWGGGALRTAALLNYLARNYDVDAIFFREQHASDPVRALPPGLVQRAHVIRLPHHSRSSPARLWRNGWRLLRRVPPLLDRFCGFGGDIARFVAGERYDLGVVEHFWCAPYHPLLANSCRRTLLDLHNVESAWHDSVAAAESGLTSVAHRQFAASYRRLEQRWLKRFDLVLAASPEDAALVGGVYYPNTIPDPGPVKNTANDSIIFSGNMEYGPNLQAARWFAQEIWPQIQSAHPGIKWRLVGKNETGIRHRLRGVGGIEITGMVEDSIAEIASARMAVVPLLSGSGTRLKILEAWAAGVPVVSTSLGAEGLGAEPGVDLLIADSANQFAAAVNHLLDSPDLRERLASSGHEKFHTTFTWEAGWKILEDLAV